MGASVSNKFGENVVSCIIGLPEESIYRVFRPNSEEIAEVSERGSLILMEVKGLFPAILAANTTLKAANVNLIGRYSVGLGLISVIFQGDVSSLKTGIEAGTIEAEKIGEVISIHIISKPYIGTYSEIIN